MTFASQTQSFFWSGDSHPDYAIPVLNERAVPASVGLLFFFGWVCFMNAWLVGTRTDVSAVELISFPLAHQARPAPKVDGLPTMSKPC